MSSVIIATQSINGEPTTQARFAFDTEGEALAVFGRLQRAASSVFQLANIPTGPRRAPDWADWFTAALAVLQSIDPAATPDVLYALADCGTFTAPTEGPPANDREAIYRQTRDLGI